MTALLHNFSVAATSTTSPYGPVSTYYLFVNPDSTVFTYVALTNSLRSHYPSDHLLVVADAQLPVTRK